MKAIMKWIYGNYRAILACLNPQLYQRRNDGMNYRLGRRNRQEDFHDFNEVYGLASRQEWVMNK
jgi:hypothetical protein